MRDTIPALPDDISNAVRRVASSDYPSGSLMLGNGKIVNNFKAYLTAWAIAYLTSTSQDGRDDALQRMSDAIIVAKEQGSL